MKEAIEIYKTALKYEPDNADVYYNVGFTIEKKLEYVFELTVIYVLKSR